MRLRQFRSLNEGVSILKALRAEGLYSARPQEETQASRPPPTKNRAARCLYPSWNINMGA